MQDNPENHTHIILGRFEEIAKDEYIEIEGALFYPLNTERFTWTRMVEIDDCKHYADIEHCHFNGAINATFENGVFSWDEIGPVHSQGKIDEMLDYDISEFIHKDVNGSEYFHEPNGSVLKITGFTSEYPEPLECRDPPEKHS